MASMQSYKPYDDTCQVICRDRSLGQVLTGNPHSHGYQAHYQDHAVKKTECYSHSASYSNGHNEVGYGHANGHNGVGYGHADGHNGVGYGHNNGHNGVGYGHANGHNGVEYGHANGHSGVGYGHNGHHAASGGMICHDKLMKKSEYKKKEKCVRNKRKDGNKSCSDSSGSDSD